MSEPERAGRESAAQLPPAVALTWGLRDGARRGPKPTLSLERVVEAATEVCDAEGLEALTMARLAKQLGVTPMAVYRYVTSKDELLIVLTDVLSGLPPEPAGDDWRADLEAWARGMLAMYRRHPWAAHIPIAGMPMTPNQVAWMDGCLTAVRGTTLTHHERASVLLMLSGLVRNQASLEADLARARLGDQPYGEEQMQAFTKLLRALVDPAKHPALIDTIDSGVWDTFDEPDTEFDFALARTLDGIQALIDSRA